MGNIAIIAPEGQSRGRSKLTGISRSLAKRGGPRWVVRTGESEDSGEGEGSTWSKLEMGGELGEVKGLNRDVRSSIRQIGGSLVL